MENGSTGTRLCDLVMKGGITSGVVYPLAVVELSKAFRFKNIGGTSAGAIAAAAAAAAELGRYRDGTDRSFRQLAELPQFLGAKPQGEDRTNLFGFFQPQAGTRRLFNTAIAGLGGGGTALLRIAAAASRHFWWAFVGGAAPGVVLLTLAARSTTGILVVVAAVFGVLVALAGGLIALLIAFAIVALRELPRNSFGLCSGMPGAGQTTATALVPWLTGYLNGLAGLDPAGVPLTFGDLSKADPHATEPTINLEMMTTCLTHGRPYRLPFRDDENVRDNRQFFFRTDDFERLFPASVVAWMAAHPRSPSVERMEQEHAFRQAGYLPLPEAKDLPVVVAVRMSLSFPILLSAVPLYAVDYSRTDAQQRYPERCWFSDGGIGSNFPIHFFDTALPRWPTFGIDLTEKHPDHPAGFYMPRTNAAATLVKWRRLDERSCVASLTGFLASIFMTAKDWTDNAQCRLPGFRDRIGQVSLTPLDGGLNLDMPADRIARLSDYGRQAGQEFVRRFATQTPEIALTWRNHRQIRLRAALAAIEEWLLVVGRSCREPQPEDEPWPEFAAQAKPPSYEWRNKAQQQTAGWLLAQLIALARQLDTTATPLEEGAPRPRPELETRPRI